MPITLLPINKEKSNGTLTDLENASKTMKGLVYNGPTKIEWKEVAMAFFFKNLDILINILKTYEVFGNAINKKALKIILIK